jgi:hypothetical protein
LCSWLAILLLKAGASFWVLVVRVLHCPPGLATTPQIMIPPFLPACCSACRECIMGVLAANPKCPLCRRCLNAGELRLGITAAEADAEEAAAEAAAAASAAAAAAAAAGGAGEAAAGGGGGGGEAGEQAPAVPPAEAALVSDSKLQALLKELRHMRRANPQAKALIFSQVRADECHQGMMRIS